MQIPLFTNIPQVYYEFKSKPIFCLQFFQNCLNMLIGLLHFPVQLGCGNTLRAMAENNHLLHAVRCSHTNTVLVRQVVGRLLNVHIRGFGLLGVDNMDAAALLN